MKSNKNLSEGYNLGCLFNALKKIFQKIKINIFFKKLIERLLINLIIIFLKYIMRLIKEKLD